ncbi:hypothetical protein [Actinoallomurus sp. NPDC052274]|uniref:hypothetical protein n=1 Tax=Actinoallomurus sp. NPDC052274 TaxID=3155420 RepID=UPI00341D80EB
MAVDRVHGADDDADKGQEQPASDRRLPRDQPGTEPKGISRADSRAAAAAANEAARQQADKTDTGKHDAAAPSAETREKPAAGSAETEEKSAGASKADRSAAAETEPGSWGKDDGTPLRDEAGTGTGEGNVTDQNPGTPTPSPADLTTFDRESPATAMPHAADRHTPARDDDTGVNEASAATPTEQPSADDRPLAADQAWAEGTTPVLSEREESLRDRAVRQDSPAAATGVAAVETAVDQDVRADAQFRDDQTGGPAGGAQTVDDGVVGGDTAARDAFDHSLVSPRDGRADEGHRGQTPTAPAENARPAGEVAPGPAEADVPAFAELGEAGHAELKAKGELPRQREAAETSSTESGRRWRTVAEEVGEVRSYPSFDAVGKDLGVRPGKELHHIVEQNQARPERSGFSVVRINTTDNLVYLPADVHTEVSRHYSTRQFGTKTTVRDSLTGKTWEQQHEYGRKTIDQAWQQIEEHRSPEDASKEPSWRTVADELGEVRSYPSFDAAGKDLGVRPGKELHHIVEQNQARPERSGFSVVRINTTDNLVYLPADVHTEVSRHYSTRQFGTKTTVRDSLTGKTWEHQNQYGRKAIDAAWRRVRSDGEA